MAYPRFVIRGEGEKKICIFEIDEQTHTSIENPIGFEVIDDDEFSVFGGSKNIHFEVFRTNPETDEEDDVGKIVVFTQIGNVTSQFSTDLLWGKWQRMLERVRGTGLTEMSREDWEAQFVPPPGASPPGSEPEGGKRRKTRARKNPRRKTHRRK